MPVVPSNLRYTRLYIRVGRYFCIETRQVACDQSLLAVPKNILSHFVRLPGEIFIFICQLL